MTNHSPDFADCIARGLIVPVDVDPDIIQKEIGLAKRDLDEAEGSIKRSSYRWATIQAYYAMSQAAKALVYDKGYREKSHRCLVIALHELYGREGLLEHDLIMDFQDAKILREEANYRGIFSELPARQSAEAARSFIEISEHLLRN